MDKKKEDNESTIKIKEFLKNYIKNNSSIYPIIKGCKYGEKKLEDLYNYLVSEKNNSNNPFAKKMAFLYRKSN